MAKLPNYDAVCVDCAHHEASTWTDGATRRKQTEHRCARPVSLVTGKRGSPISCVTMRSMAGACGPDGRLFEQKKLEAAE